MTTGHWMNFRQDVHITTQILAIIAVIIMAVPVTVFLMVALLMAKIMH